MFLVKISYDSNAPQKILKYVFYIKISSNYSRRCESKIYFLIISFQKYDLQYANFDFKNSLATVEFRNTSRIM